MPIQLFFKKLFFKKKDAHTPSHALLSDPGSPEVTAGSAKLRRAKTALRRCAWHRWHTGGTPVAHRWFTVGSPGMTGVPPWLRKLPYLVGGLNPSEKYNFLTLGFLSLEKWKKVPKHQPDIVWGVSEVMDPSHSRLTMGGTPWNWFFLVTLRPLLNMILADDVCSLRVEPTSSLIHSALSPIWWIHEAKSQFNGVRSRYISWVCVFPCINPSFFTCLMTKLSAYSGNSPSFPSLNPAIPIFGKTHMSSMKFNRTLPVPHPPFNPWRLRTRGKQLAKHFHALTRGHNLRTIGFSKHLEVLLKENLKKKETLNFGRDMNNGDIWRWFGQPTYISKYIRHIFGDIWR